MYKEKLQSGIISEGEFRKGMIEKVITFFEKAHIFDRVQQLLQSENIKKIISFEEFKDFLIRVNGVIREIPTKDRDTDGKNIYLGGSGSITYLPRYEDKEGLLFETYNALDKINKGDLQYFIPLLINAIHIFKDGNGRTSRVFNLLLSNPVSKEDFYFELDKALGVNGRYEYKNISTEHIYKQIVKILLNKNHIDIKQGLDILDHELFDKINNLNEEFIDLWGSDKDFGNMIIIKYLREINKIDSCMDSGSLSIDLMNEKLDKNDWDNLVKGFYNSKKEMVEIMIDMFVNPDNYHVDDMNPTTIKDLLINRVNRQKE